MKKRLKKIIIISFSVCIIGILYAVFYRITGVAIPCIFRKITGLKCPGCGITTMFMHMLYGEFGKAWNDNQAIFCLIPLFIVLVLYHSFQYIKFGKIIVSKAENTLYIILIIILILFGIHRNKTIILNSYNYFKQL